MSGMDTGLRYRVRRAARQIAEQHDNLQDIARALDGAIGERALPRMKELMTRYSGALDAHFSLEERVFFPALHGLHPERGEELERLSQAHRSFEAVIDRLRRSLDSADLDGFGSGFRRMIADMDRHEQHEERLFGVLTAAEG
jgi:iron-sulfur cluster repair protein YtfE (RIC family)